MAEYNGECEIISIHASEITNFVSEYSSLCEDKNLYMHLVPYLKVAMRVSTDICYMILEKLSGSNISSGIFSSKESEHLQRASLLRKLNLFLLCCESKKLMDILPTLQDRLLELLKFNSPILDCQIFESFRILLLSFGFHSLNNIWGATFCHISSICLSILESKTLEISESQRLISICKFLELLHTVEPSASLIYSWGLFSKHDTHSGLMFDLLVKRMPELSVAKVPENITSDISDVTMYILRLKTHIETSSEALNAEAVNLLKIKELEFI